MPQPDARTWNERYAHEPGLYVHPMPRPLVTGHPDLIPEPGLALDVACGTAATGLYLARRGWQVVGLDVAETALRLAQRRARKEVLDLWLAVMDVTDLWLPHEQFDLVLNFYFLQRRLWKLYRKVLKPGGVLFLETFVWHPGEKSRREFFLEPGELHKAFADWEILLYDEGLRRRNAEDERIVAKVIARKTG